MLFVFHCPKFLRNSYFYEYHLRSFSQCVFYREKVSERNIVFKIVTVPFNAFDAVIFSLPKVPRKLIFLLRSFTSFMSMCFQQRKSQWKKYCHRNSCRIIQHIWCSEISTAQSSLETHISVKIIHVFKCYQWDGFSFQITIKSFSVFFSGCDICKILYFFVHRVSSTEV